MDIEKLEIFKSLCEVEDADVSFYKDSISKDSLKKKKQFIHEHYPPSPSLFPCLISEHETGSSVEYLNIIGQSDIDSIYEVGPGLVRDLKEKNLNDDFEGFYWEKTNHVGFYTIQDSKGKYLYPQIIQQKLAPILTFREPSNEYGVLRLQQKLAPGSTYPKKKLFDIDEIEDPTAAIKKTDVGCEKDCVVGMRLEKWPKEVVEAFHTKERLEDLQDVPLFLIPKGHPDSENRKLEWRLSFSLVENEILMKLPDYQRRAYLNWKKAKRDWLRNNTYLLKTILMKVSYDFLESLQPLSFNIVSFKLKLDEELQRSLKERHFPNFFLPQQNLFQGIENVPSLISTERKESPCFENYIADACHHDPFSTFLSINFFRLIYHFNTTIREICQKKPTKMKYDSRGYEVFLKAFLRLRVMCMLRNELKSVDFEEFLRYLKCWGTLSNQISKKTNDFETLVKEVENIFDSTVHKWFGEIISFIEKKITIGDEFYSLVCKRNCNAGRIYDSFEECYYPVSVCVVDFDGNIKEFLATPTSLLRRRFKNH